MNHTQPFGGISGSTLKLIAIITMFVDHLGATVLRTVMKLPVVLANDFWSVFWQSMYSCSRSIGRIAFPVFCFLIVEGFTHTRNVWKYALRMFLFALISEIPFDLALKGSWYYPGKQNVYFTLLIGLLVLIALDKTAQLCCRLSTCFGKSCRSVGILLFRCCILPASSVLIIWAGMRLAAIIDTDYNFKGVFLIAVLYLVQRFGMPDTTVSSDYSDFRSSRLFQCFAGAMAVSWELPAPLAFLPVYLYNGTRGLRMKYFFYFFYPAHLLFLHWIADYLIPLAVR